MQIIAASAYLRSRSFSRHINGFFSLFLSRNKLLRSKMYLLERQSCVLFRGCSVQNGTWRKNYERKRKKRILHCNVPMLPDRRGDENLSILSFPDRFGAAGEAG
jgi:hypothetical protein